MIADIATGFTALKTAGEVLALMLKLKTDDAVREKVSALYIEIVSLTEALSGLHSLNADLTRQNNDLQKEKEAMHNWDHESRRYSLCEIGFRVFVYAPKKPAKPGEQTVWYCTNCFDNRKLSIIQFHKTLEHSTLHHCPACGVNFHEHREFRLPA